MTYDKIGSILRDGIRLAKNEGLRRFIKELPERLYWELLGYRLILPRAIRKFKDKLTKIIAVDQAIDLAFEFEYLGLNIKPVQFKSEIAQLVDNINELSPKNLLEIGTASGGTLFMFCRASSLNARILSVDLPGGKFGGGYSNSRVKWYESFAKQDQEIILLRRNSHERATLDEVKKILSGKPLDFLFIDGDHTYEGVKKDFEMYGNLVRKGGIIAFHDIVKNQPESGCDVEKFWHEIRNHYNFKEFIENPEQGTCGIGLMYI